MMSLEIVNREFKDFSVFHFTRIVAKRSVFFGPWTLAVRANGIADTNENATVSYDTF